MTQNSEFPMKSCGSVVWVRLAHGSNSEHDTAISLCILYKRVLWFEICFVLVILQFAMQLICKEQLL